MDKFIRCRPSKAKLPGIPLAYQQPPLGNYDVLSHGGGTFTHAIPPAFAA
jgi:hypothetical protein